jgi:hypothetical protein
MAGFTSAMPNSYKSELPQGLHRHQGSIAVTGTTTNASSNVTAISNMSGVAPGCGIAGGAVPANSFIANLSGASQITIGPGPVATGGAAGQNLTITGDTFKIALGKAGVTGTYGASTTNYSNLTGNSDEVANGNGYTTGGFAWTPAQNIQPAFSSTQTYWSWSVNPSWTGATLSTDGCIIYNSSSNGRAVYVGSFGGTQTVTAGTLTLLLPTNGPGTSLLQLN